MSLEYREPIGYRPSEVRYLRRAILIAPFVVALATAATVLESKTGSSTPEEVFPEMLEGTLVVHKGANLRKDPHLPLANQPTNRMEWRYLNVGGRDLATNDTFKVVNPFITKGDDGSENRDASGTEWAVVDADVKGLIGTQKQRLYVNLSDSTREVVQAHGTIVPVVK